MKRESNENGKGQSSKGQKVKLIAISPEMRNRVMDYRAAFLNNGEEKINGSFGLSRFEAFDEWFKQLGVVAEGWVPTSTFAAVRLPDNVIVGMVNIRHYLTEAIYNSGHIGYSVRPEERGKGYGTEILRQALIKAELLGIIETVVCCNEGNRASKRVMVKNNLSLQKKVTEENGNKILIYTR